MPGRDLALHIMSPQLHIPIAVLAFGALAVLTIILCAPLLAGKVGASVLTGLGLGLGFALKDSIFRYVSGWKTMVEFNLSAGRAPFYNPVMVESARWRRDPINFESNSPAGEQSCQTFNQDIPFPTTDQE